MNEYQKSKKSRLNNYLFNPYKNGISSYDLAYLSSKRIRRNKSIYIQSEVKDKHFAA